MKPIGCKECVLCEEPGFTKANEVSRPILLVQGEAPGSDEIKSGLAFTGPSGKYLRTKILGNAGVNHEQVIFDNTIRCLVGGKSGGYPTGKTRKEAEAFCKQYEIWERHSSVPLLLVGAKSIGSRMEDDRVGRWHGHIEFDGRRVTGCTYHPSAVMRKPNLLPLVVQEVRNLMKASRNPSVLDLPDVWKGRIPHTILSDAVVFDLEWDKNGKIICWGLARNGGEAWSTYDVIDIRQMLDANYIRGNKIVGHNIVTADLVVLGYTPVEIRDMSEQLFDTMLMSHLVHPHFAEAGLFGLSDMVKYYEPVGEWKSDKADMLEYNGRDCAYNYRLFKHLERDIAYTKQEHLMKKQHEFAALTVAMKQQGIMLDHEALQDYADTKMEERKNMAAMFPFNPNSWQQITKWAKEEMKISLRNTRFETLKKYEGRHPIMDKLIEFKEDTKALSTWFPFEEDETGRLVLTNSKIHPTTNATGTDVVRSSSSDPNIQNIPGGGPRLLPGGLIKTMPNLRRFFTAGPDEELWSLDYSQLEDWTIGYCSQDKQLLEDLLSGKDIHRLTAAEFMTRTTGRVIDPESFSKKGPERYKGKQTNHQAKYVITPPYLAKQMYGSSERKYVQEAEALLSAYFGRYKGIRRLHKKLAQQFENGDIELVNPFGRRRRIYAHESMYKYRGIYDQLVMLHHEKVKMGAHFLGCSTGAEIVNQRAIDIWRQLGLVPRFLVHDELCYTLPRGEEGERIALEVKSIMGAPVKELGGLSIPVGVARGPNYGELKEWSE